MTLNTFKLSDVTAL